jgi:hypothetical protein
MDHWVYNIIKSELSKWMIPQRNEILGTSFSLDLKHEGANFSTPNQPSHREARKLLFTPWNEPLVADSPRLQL